MGACARLCVAHPGRLKGTGGVASRSWRVASVAASRRVGVCDWSCAAAGPVVRVGAVGSVDLSLIMFMAHRVGVVVLALLTVAAQQPHAVTVGDEPQRVLSIAPVAAHLAPVVGVVGWLPPDCALSRFGHDGSRIASMFDGLRRRRANRGRIPSKRHASQQTIARRSCTVAVTGFVVLSRSPQQSQRKLVD